MKPCKIIARVYCEKHKKKVRPSCIACPGAIIEVLNLQDEVIFRYENPGKKKKVKGEA